MHRAHAVPLLVREAASGRPVEASARVVVGAANAPALALYESFGFERDGYRKRHYERADELVDAVLMVSIVD